MFPLKSPRLFDQKNISLTLFLYLIFQKYEFILKKDNSNNNINDNNNNHVYDNDNDDNNINDNDSNNINDNHNNDIKGTVKEK